MDKTTAKAPPKDPGTPDGFAIDPDRDDVVDLGATDAPWEDPIRLSCSSCTDGVESVGDPESEAHRDVPAKTRPVRKKTDPDTVVRCARCGKKHSNDVLTIVDE